MTIDLTPAQAGPHIHGELAVVIPIYNEEATIRSVVAEWKTVFESLGISYSFILLNDGSKDKTLQVLETISASMADRAIVINKANAGHGRTCRAGYDAAVSSPVVEWVLQIDSDGQCDPAYFKDFWNIRNNADCVFGQRVQRDDGTARMLTSKICKFGATLLGGRDMVDPNVPYRLIRREVLKSAIETIPASFDIHNVALTFTMKQNPQLRWHYVPIRFRDRQGGSNSINLLNVAHLGTSMLFDLAKLRKR
jgi:glycosyltransferase involved in cell wall biosynthesis